MELAEVSGAGAHGGGLYLNAKIVACVFDADVVRLGISPGLADGEAALGCRCHELQFDPFAAFFETFEFLPILHCSFSRVLLPPRPTTSVIGKESQTSAAKAAIVSLISGAAEAAPFQIGAL